MSNNEKGLTIVRVFDASKETVFDAFSSPDAFSKWWGPAGMPVTTLHFDFKDGGRLHYKMEGNGQVMWGLFNYKKIRRPDVIEFISSFSDESGNISKSPFPMDFPLEIFNRIELVEKEGKTTLTLTGHPVNATKAQEDTYFSIIQNMQQGFKGTFDQLEGYLRSIL